MEAPKLTCEYELLAAAAKEGTDVTVYAVGATVSQGEKRFIKQYHGNDYFCSYSTKFSRPIALTDTKGMSSANKQLALAASLATTVNRKMQVRDGIKQEIGIETDNLFSTLEGKIIEGAVLPASQVESVKAQILALLGKLPTTAGSAPVATKKATRKRAPKVATSTTPTAEVS